MSWNKRRTWAPGEIAPSSDYVNALEAVAYAARHGKSDELQLALAALEKTPAHKVDATDAQTLD